MRLLLPFLVAGCAERTDPAPAADSSTEGGPAVARATPEPGAQALLIGPSAATAPLQELLASTYDYPHVRSVAPTSGGAVLQALDSLAGRLSSDSPAVVYIAGPGARVRDVNLDEPDPWDEALAVGDDLVLDDQLAPRLDAVAAAGGSLTVVFDVALPGEGRPSTATAATDPAGDGRPDWPQAGQAVTIVLDSRAADAPGLLGQALAAHAPRSATYLELEQRLLADGPLLERAAVVEVRGDHDRPVFGVVREVAEETVTEFVLDPVPLPVRLALPGARAAVFEDRVAEDGRLQPWLSLSRADKPGSFSVQENPLSREGGLIVVGPEGAIRNQFEPDGTDGLEARVLEQLWWHARQHAFRFLGLPPASDLTVRMVEAPDQPECSRGRWKEAEPGRIQIVPVCHRWQVEVSLAASAPGPREVGGVLLGNDGTTIGFPVRGEAVTVQPGGTHRFRLPVSGSMGPEGVKSIPPLGIAEYVMVYTGPPGSNVPFHKASSVGTSMRSLTAPGAGSWQQIAVTYRIEANPGDDPLQPLPTRELTLDGYDVRPLLPANTNSYLYRLLHNAERLAHIKGGDGLDYAQCLPRNSSGINNRSRYSETEWPDGTCWSQPWDFRRDEREFMESPGIDCSTTVWWMFTRACLGNTAARLPERRSGESTGRYLDRVRTFHTEERKCLLLTDENYRGGYLNTEFMLKDELMSRHWDRCDSDALRTGDVLVTKTERGGGGHTYVVIDPDNYVVFGSHIADLDFDRLTPEFKELWAEYEREAGDRDAGVEYQFLTYRRDKEGGRFSGFMSEVVKACWRHKVLAAEYDREPTSRPRSGAMEGACRDGICLTTTAPD